MFFRSFFTGPGKHLQKVASPTVLNHAWRLLRKDPGCWERGLPVAEMERNVIRHVGELSRELLAGTYRPQPMRCYKVKKADGKDRILCTAAVRDKLVQRAVLTVLEPFQARELAAELLDYLDQRADSLLVCRLSRRGNAGPIHALARSPRHPQLVGRKTAVHTTGSLPGGWYLLAYDITDPARLQRIQRHAAKVCVYLQRSVYLYHGAGAPLASLLAILREEIRPGSDDMRLYYFAGPGDLWFPSGPLPPLAGLDGKGTGASLWQRLMAWLGSG